MPGSPSILVVSIGEFPGDTAGAHLVARLCRGLDLAGWKPMVLSVGFSPSHPTGMHEGNDPQWEIPYRTAYVSSARLPLYNIGLCRRAAPVLVSMIAEQLRHDEVRAVLCIGSTYFGFQPLLDLCERIKMPIVSYELEYPVWKNWTRVMTGGHLDHLLYLCRTLPRMTGIVGISSFWTTKARSLGIPFVVVPSYLPDEVSKCVVRYDGFYPQRPHSFHLVTLGLWVPRECPFVLLRAIKEAHLAGVPIRYTAIGKIGSTPTERAAMKEYKRDPILRKIVRITGWVDEPKKNRLLDSADAFVLLRRQNIETAALFPTRLPEYLAHARPVIASSAGDLSRYLQHKRSAWLIPADDDGSHLLEAIRALHNDPELAKAIGQGGLAQAMESFSIEGNGAKMSEFIGSVIDRGSSE